MVSTSPAATSAHAGDTPMPAIFVAKNETGALIKESDPAVLPPRSEAILIFQK
jgi:hypothetical protein